MTFNYWWVQREREHEIEGRETELFQRIRLANYLLGCVLATGLGLARQGEKIDLK